MTLDATALTERGHASLGPLLTADQCRDLIALWDRPERFRSTVVMARHNFGRGEYRYFADPLPEVVSDLRRRLYGELVGVVNAGSMTVKYHPDFDGFQAHCRAGGQAKPTPLLLRYGPGDYNCLHQDLYGGVVFPLQVVILLNDGFTGGEFVLVENRPRMQSRATAVPLSVGEGLVFFVRDRPVQGRRGPYRATLRHGVSTVRSGVRHTLGIIFHDAA